MVAILMKPAKLATLDFFKIMFLKKGYEVLIFVNDVTNKNS